MSSRVGSVQRILSPKGAAVYFPNRVLERGNILKHPRLGQTVLLLEVQPTSREGHFIVTVNADYGACSGKNIKFGDRIVREEWFCLLLHGFDTERCDGDCILGMRAHFVLTPPWAEKDELIFINDNAYPEGSQLVRT